MKILIISAFFYKAEGSIAKGLAATLTNHEVYFYSTGEIKHRSNELDHLLQNVDVVHWLVNVAHLKKQINPYFFHCKIPQLATVHHVCTPEMDKVTVASHADVVHVVSDEWKTFVENNTNTPCITAHLGIKPQDFERIHASLYTSGTFKIGMMGFYPGKYNRKRADVAINVFKELSNRGFDFEIMLQGGGWESYLPDLDAHQIKYTHIQATSGAQILRFFEKIHVYLCTSDFEGGPLPVLEALQSGVPVVSTDIGAAHDALIHGGGILCEKANVQQLSDALVRMQADVSFYTECAQKAKHIAKKFHWESLRAEYTYLYESTVAQWSLKNNQVWQWKTGKGQAALQRERELMHDSIHEGMSFLYHKKTRKALQILKKPMLSKMVATKRKRKILAKRVVVYLLTGRKN